MARADQQVRVLRLIDGICQQAIFTERTEKIKELVTAYEQMGDGKRS
jgi:hypothetical protein